MLPRPFMTVRQLGMRADLHALISQNRTILLDMRRNRYFGLPLATDHAFQRWCAGALEDGDNAKLRPMVAAGLLVEASAAGPISPPRLPLPPTAEIPMEKRGEGSVTVVLRCLAAQARASWWLRHHSLAEIRLLLEARRARGILGNAPDPLQCSATIAAGFASTEWILAPLDRCLPRSLAFCLVAAASQVAARLVIGVRTNPFAAHSWSEFGGTVLNDRLERVRGFTPIVSL